MPSTDMPLSNNTFACDTGLMRTRLWRSLLASKSTTSSSAPLLHILKHSFRPPPSVVRRFCMPLIILILSTNDFGVTWGKF